MKCLFGYHDWYKENNVHYLIIDVKDRETMEAATNQFPGVFCWHDFIRDFEVPDSKPIFRLRYNKECFNGICRRCHKVHTGYTDAQIEADKLIARAIVMQQKQESLDTKLANTLKTHTDMRRRI